MRLLLLACCLMLPFCHVEPVPNEHEEKPQYAEDQEALKYIN